MAARVKRSSGMPVEVVPLLFLSIVLAAGCSHTNPMSAPDYEVTGYSGCKDVRFVHAAGDSGVTEACVRYEYDGVGALSLTHLDTAFNCGAVDVGAEIEFSAAGLIQIEEWEDLPVPADCICLFDVAYRITYIDPGTYRVVIVERYLNPGDEQFDFALDLTGPVSGEICVPRSGYPWN